MRSVEVFSGPLQFNNEDRPYSNVVLIKKYNVISQSLPRAARLLEAGPRNPCWKFLGEVVSLTQSYLQINK